MFKQAGQNVKLTTHVHLVLQLRKRGSITPLQHTSLWHGGQLNMRATVTINLLELFVTLGNKQMLQKWYFSLYNLHTQYYQKHQIKQNDVRHPNTPIRHEKFTQKFGREIETKNHLERKCLGCKMDLEGI